MKIPFLMTAVAVIALSSGCMSREAPTARSQTTGTGISVSIARGTVKEDSKIVDIFSPKVDIGFKKKTNIIGAERASIISTGTSTPGGTTTYNDDFIIRYSESIDQSNTIEIPITLKNASERAFDLSGIVIRANSSNAEVKASIPGDVTNGKRLAPGESLIATLTLGNADRMQTNEIVTVKMFEVPGEINSSGEITNRVNAEIIIMATRTEEPVILETYYTKEPRVYTGNAPADLRRFLK